MKQFAWQHNGKRMNIQHNVKEINKDTAFGC